MDYRITVRYGHPRQRHHTMDLEASDVAQALRMAADRIPRKIVETADLVELRTSPDPDKRAYVGQDP